MAGFIYRSSRLPRNKFHGLGAGRDQASRICLQSDSGQERISSTRCEIITIFDARLTGDADDRDTAEPLPPIISAFSALAWSELARTRSPTDRTLVIETSLANGSMPSSAASPWSFVIDMRI